MNKIVWIIVVIIAVFLCFFTRNINNQLGEQQRKIDCLEKLVCLQTTIPDSRLIPIISGIVNVLSNQTQSIKDIKDILDIKADQEVALPEMEEMLPSSTNGINLGGVDDFKNNYWRHW